MKTGFLLATVSLIILIMLSGCGPDLNTDFDPPKPDANLTDVFPEEIGGMKGVGLSDVDLLILDPRHRIFDPGASVVGPVASIIVTRY